MEPVLVGIVVGTAAALVVKAVGGTARRARGWYRDSVKDSLAELAVVPAGLGAVVGAVWERSGH